MNLTLGHNALFAASKSKGKGPKNFEYQVAVEKRTLYVFWGLKVNEKLFQLMATNLKTAKRELQFEVVLGF